MTWENQSWIQSWCRPVGWSTSFARESEIFQPHSHAAKVCASELCPLTSLVSSADSCLCSWLWHSAANTGSVYLICLPAHAFQAQLLHGCLVAMHFHAVTQLGKSKEERQDTSDKENRFYFQKEKGNWCLLEKRSLKAIQKVAGIAGNVVLYCSLLSFGCTVCCFTFYL